MVRVLAKLSARGSPTVAVTCIQPLVVVRQRAIASHSANSNPVKISTSLTLAYTPAVHISRIVLSVHLLCYLSACGVRLSVKL